MAVECVGHYSVDCKEKVGYYLPLALSMLCLVNASNRNAVLLPKARVQSARRNCVRRMALVASACQDFLFPSGRGDEVRVFLFLGSLKITIQHGA